MGYRKGYRFENWLVNELKKHGFVVIRSAKSGGIDVVALKDGKTFGFECKYSSGSRIRVPESEMKFMERFMDQGGLAFLVVKFKRKGVWVLYPNKSMSEKELKVYGLPWDRFIWFVC
ncbi:MAG: hypothetical protein DRP12_00240 [Candidatus Aenigmatarchaeota archaeon]|nr:MAG: hypothetical protein DRP12_00240 [Candidatus Aenigmarchaeota archaeon]